MKIRKDGIMDPTGKYPNPFNKKPYSKFYLNLAKVWSKYQTYEDRMDIFKKLYYNSIILVIAGTGVGKTVIIPKLLAHYFNYDKPILVATPRQKSTEEAVDWSAKLLDVPIFYYSYKEGGSASNILDRSGTPIRTGNTYVGFKHGGIKDPIISNKTKLFYSTDSTIKQMIIQGDTYLKDYGGIVIDEAHERSVSIDILIALVTDIVRKRSDFKVIIMSATVSKDIFIDYFNRMGLGNKFTTYEAFVPGQFPVDSIYLDKKINKANYIDKAFELVEKIVNNPKQVQINKKGELGLGDILVFVATTSDGEKLKNMIKKNLDKYPENAKPYPVVLTAKTKELEKEIAIKEKGINKIPESEGKFHRKLIISTNVAESSITFEDPLVYVVESAVEFSNYYYANLYAYKGGITFIAKANIKQRCGRTGRTSPGFCYRVYTENQYEKEIIDYPPPKILTQDLTSDYLALLNLEGIKTVDKTNNFLKNMIQPFEDIKEQINTSIKNLTEMGVISSTNKLKSIGFVMNKFGKFDYKIAKMIIAGYYFGVLQETIALGAILQTISSIDKMFKKLTNPQDEKEKKELISTMKHYYHNSGDHITCLNFFVEWYNSYNRHKFEIDFKLNHDTLKDIETHYDELLDQVIQIKDYFPQLNLFDTNADKLFGGSRQKKNIKIINNGEHKETNFKSNYLYGGNTICKNVNTNIRKSKRNMLLNYQNFIKSNKRIKSIKSIKSGGEQKGTIKQTKFQHNFKKKFQDKKEKEKQRQKQKQTKKIKQLTEEQKEKYRKKRETLESFSLKNLKKNTKINIFNDKNDNILACLLYGYTNQMGIYSGNGYDYVIKFSDEVPSIKKTMLHKIEETPKLIVYNQFMIMNNQKMLSMVSKIDKKIVDVFRTV